MLHKTSDYLIRRATLRQLQIFVIVARQGGFTKAAEQLHLSQPTVSMQVHKLSETLDSPLFEQLGKKLYLTAAGQKVLSAAEDILERLSHLHDDMMELKHKVKGELHIAAVTNAKYFMPRLLGVFLQQHPEVKPYLKVTNRSSVIKRIKEGHQDELFILGQLPEDMDVANYCFLENKLVVIASPRHPLAKQAPVSLAQLSQERFLMRETGSGTRLAVEQRFQKNNLTINPYMELGSSEAIKQAVMAGLGLSVLSLDNLSLELRGGYIAVLQVEGFPLIRYWNAMHLKNKKLSLVARTFLDFLRNEGKTVLAEELKWPVGYDAQI